MRVDHPFAWALLALFSLGPVSVVLLALGMEPLELVASMGVEAAVQGFPLAFLWPYTPDEHAAEPEVQWEHSGFETQWPEFPEAATEEAAGPAFGLAFAYFVVHAVSLPIALSIAPRVPDGGLVYVMGVVLAGMVSLWAFMIVWIWRGVANRVFGTQVVEVSMRGRELVVDGEKWTRRADDHIERRPRALILSNGDRVLKIPGSSKALGWLHFHLQQHAPEPDDGDVPDALEALR